MIWEQQPEANYPDTARPMRDLERVQCEWNQAIPERVQLRSELEQVQKLQQEAATRYQLKSELKQVQKLCQEAAKSKDRKMKTQLNL